MSRRPRGGEPGRPRRVPRAVAGAALASAAAAAAALAAGAGRQAALAAGAGRPGVLAGAPAGAGRSRPAAVAPWAPLATSLATASATWADVPMGILGDPVDTFWQLFVLPLGGSRWSLVTPPGVADNGGLVASATGAGSLAVGFETSLLLAFSPLATTDDLGRRWSPVPDPVPHPLAADPDALAVAPSGAALALVRSPGSSGSSVLASARGLGGWRTAATSAEIASSPAGRLCSPRRLTAVALGAAGGVLVGADCARPGTVGILERRAGASGGASFSPAGPLLPRTARSSTVSVLRLVAGADGVAALLELSGAGPGTGAGAGAGAGAGGSGERLEGAAQAPGGHWSLSPSLRLPAGASISSTGVVEPSSGAEARRRVPAAPGWVVSWRASRSSGAERAALALHGGGWVSLPPLPPGAAAVAVTASGSVHALGVDRSRMTAYVLAPGGRRWSAIQHLDVPIEYGSSGGPSGS